MKLTIAKDQIISGLQAVQNVVSTRTTLPVLSNVLLKAEGDRLHLTATDLDVTISCSVEAKVETPGALTIPARKIFGIVRELGASEISLETDDKGTFILSAGSSYYKINGLPAEDFPPMPKFANRPKIVMTQEKVRAMLKKTSFAVSTDESRYVLNGIFISFKDHKVTMVATDGRRLALTYEELDLAEDQHMDLIVPTKAITELVRLLAGNGEVEIETSENQIAFQMRQENGFSILLISKLVEGNYPNYRQVIPSETGERVPLVREEFLHALRRAEIMTSDKANSVKLTFSKNNLSITANTPDVGEARESLAVNYKGPEFSIAFNPIYMMDPLKALDHDEVYMEFIDELSPGVLKINEPFLYIIMPMRTT